MLLKQNPDLYQSASRFPLHGAPGQDSQILPQLGKSFVGLHNTCKMTQEKHYKVHTKWQQNLKLEMSTVGHLLSKRSHIRYCSLQRQLTIALLCNKLLSIDRRKQRIFLRHRHHGKKNAYMWTVYVQYASSFHV